MVLLDALDEQFLRLCLSIFNLKNININVCVI